MTELLVQEVSKRFGGVVAVNDLTLELAPGRIVGLIGPNGAGKTTMVNLMTGIMAPTSGSIRMGDVVLSGGTPVQVARAGVARTFQNIRLFKDATVLDNIVAGCHRHETTSLLANMFALPSAWRERASFRARAEALLAEFGMGAFATLRAGGLSYGHQRRVEIMRALALKPAFLLLDEPVAGMNDVEAEELGRIFVRLARENIGLLVIEHDVNFISRICHHVYAVDSGRLIAAGTPAEVMADPAVIEAYLGSGHAAHR